MAEGTLGTGFGVAIMSYSLKDVFEQGNEFVEKTAASIVAEAQKKDQGEEACPSACQRQYQRRLYQRRNVARHGLPTARIRHSRLRGRGTHCPWGQAKAWQVLVGMRCQYCRCHRWQGDGCG